MNTKTQEQGSIIVVEDRARKSSPPAVVGDATPMALIQMAVQRGADIDYLKQLMDLQERHEANEAKKAYNTAFAAFKSEAVTVLRSTEYTAGPLVGKSYAELHAFVDAIGPVLSKYGLGHSWKVTKDDKDWIEVTCYLRHEMGHFETNSLGGPPDTGGSKNAIQARASTVTYLEKYTLKGVCGVAEKNDDRDGNTGGRTGGSEGGQYINDEQVEALTQALALKNLSAKWLCSTMRVDELDEIPADRYDVALNNVQRAKAQAHPPRQ